MFQFLRRVSGSLLPRPDRPCRDDATSLAPTIGCKRRRSITESYGGDSAKRTRNEPASECDSVSEGESTKGGAASPVDGHGVKEVTKGVREVDLGNKDEIEDLTPIRPEGVPLPDSRSGSPEPEPESESELPKPTKPHMDEENKDEEHAEGITSSSPEDVAEDAKDSGKIDAQTTTADRAGSDGQGGHS